MYLKTITTQIVGQPKQRRLVTRPLLVHATSEKKQFSLNRNNFQDHKRRKINFTLSYLSRCVALYLFHKISSMSAKIHQATNLRHHSPL